MKRYAMSVGKLLTFALLAVSLCCGSAAAASPKKDTKFESFSANPTPASIGQPVTLSAQLHYLDKQRRWQPLNYKSVRVIFSYANHQVGTAMTGRDGWASFTYTIPRTERPGNKGIKVVFPGDQELQGCWKPTGLTVKK